MSGDFDETYDRQAKLIYSLIVAGKSANFADRACRDFIIQAAKVSGVVASETLPFESMRHLTVEAINGAARAARTGNYKKLSLAITQICKTNLDLATCTPSDLEKIHGFGPKTSRFYILWTRPHEIHAVLDVHILRWLKAHGYQVPAATPQNRKTYAQIEQWFIAEATKLGKTPRELDYEIWSAGAGRTQETPLPQGV